MNKHTLLNLLEKLNDNDDYRLMLNDTDCHLNGSVLTNSWDSINFDEVSDEDIDTPHSIATVSYNGSRYVITAYKYVTQEELANL